jgi:hypothetical protein
VRQAHGWEASALAEVDQLHARIWRAASAGVRARPELALLILPPVNEVLDVHALRVNATRKHIPGLVLGLLLTSSLLAITVIGYGCGMDGHRRWPLTLSLTLLIAGSLWITIDLDHPRRGLLRLNDAPLQALVFTPP